MMSMVLGSTPASASRRGLLMEWLLEPARGPVTAGTAGFDCTAYRSCLSPADLAYDDLVALEERGLVRRFDEARPIRWVVTPQ